jgi:Uma2 family endonuclease
MTTRGMTPAVPPPPPPKVPPLEPGDHLTRDEFERRYDATPGLKKAELIEGVVYMPPPVRVTRHGSPHADLVGWLVWYRAGTPGIRAADNATLRLDLENEPQPDAVLLIEPSCGGQARISADDYVEGAPELVAEVAASTASIDLNTKLQVYRRNGAREYLVWRVLDADFDWFILRQGRYERLPQGADGVYRSETFPGLWLDAAAMARTDIATVLAVLQQGLASPEHTGFVTSLQSARQRHP